jgi:hypothetical protein
MGISLLHYMASGNNYPDWINEYEDVRYPPFGDNQDLHTDSAAHAQVAYPVALPEENTSRDTPPSATLTGSDCGLRHGDPRVCTPRQHAQRLNAMQRTYHEGDKGAVVTEPPRTTERYQVLSTKLMTNGWHAGQGQRARTLARFGLFLACMQIAYRQSPFGPDKHNTTTSVVLASGYEKPVNALDSPDEVATMFSSANPYVEQYPTAVVRDERGGTVDIEIVHSVVSLKPATQGVSTSKSGSIRKTPIFERQSQRPRSRKSVASHTMSP